MPLKQFIVPLGVSILTFAIVGIYLHCRQRLNALENKMNILFQLIQQHTASSQEQQNISMIGHPQGGAGELIPVSDDEGTDSESSDSDDSDESETSDDEEYAEESCADQNIRSIDISSTLPVISLDDVNATLSVSKIDSISSKSSTSDLGDVETLHDEPTETISEEVRAELGAVNYAKFTVPKLKELVDKFGLVKSSGKLKRAQLINILDAAKL